MKIVYINSVYKKGSTGKIVADLHEFCSKNGIDSYVLYGRGQKTKEHNVYKVSYEFFSKLNVIRSRITGMIYSGNYLATRKAKHLLKRIKPDIVHIHNLNDQYINEYKLLKFLAKKKIKTVITLHSEQMYTGTCGYSLDCEKWKNGGCDKCPHIVLSTNSHRDATKKAFKKLKCIYSLFDFNMLSFISCTPWLKSRAQNSDLLKSFNHIVILNGSDEASFKLDTTMPIDVRKKYAISDGEKVILFVNPRMSDPIKGHQFIDSISIKLPKDHKIVIVGKTPNNIDKNKFKNVIYVGEILNKNDLATLYNAADCTILLSKRECFPMVIVESILCGTPVISFKCGGPDNAYSNEFVKFVDYGDVEMLIKLITQNKKERELVASYAKQIVSSSIMKKNYFNYYKKL